MKISNIENIQKSQIGYRQILNLFVHESATDTYSIKKIVSLIDEIKFFWTERLDIIKYELEQLSEKKECLLLCGAMYLNVSDYEHYYFKTFADYHLLFDPLLKIEPYIRAPEDKINEKETIDLFNEILSDVKKIVNEYENEFIILPIRELAIFDDKEHKKMLNKTFLNILSEMFGKIFKSHKDFCDQFHTFEEIEKKIVPHILKMLIFNDHTDREESLRKRIEKYSDNQRNFKEMTKGQSEAELFIFVVYASFSQVIDIMLICTYLKVIPYIRHEITFHYFLTMMHIFTEDDILKEMIEKTIIMYVFRKVINPDVFEKIQFDEYYLKIKDRNILENIRNALKNKGIEIFEGDARQVREIITHEVQNICTETVFT